MAMRTFVPQSWPDHDRQVTMTSCAIKYRKTLVNYEPLKGVQLRPGLPTSWTCVPHKEHGNNSLEIKILLDGEQGITAGDSHAVDVTLPRPVLQVLGRQPWVTALLSPERRLPGALAVHTAGSIRQLYKQVLVKGTGATCPLNGGQAGCGLSWPTGFPRGPLRLFPVSSTFQVSSYLTCRPRSIFRFSASPDSPEESILD